MSPKPNYGPNWFNDFTEIDKPIIKNQKEFSTCYQNRKLDNGKLYLKIIIKKGTVDSIVKVKNSLSPDLSKCFIEKLKKVAFPKDVNITLNRYFEYSKTHTKGHL